LLCEALESMTGLCHQSVADWREVAGEVVNSKKGGWRRTPRMIFQQWPAKWQAILREICGETMSMLDYTIEADDSALARAA
jgi:hypothetical protein